MPLIAKPVVEVTPDAHFRFTIQPDGSLIIAEIEPDGNERLTILSGDAPFLLASFVLKHHNMIKSRQATATRREQDDPDPPEMAIEKQASGSYRLNYRGQVMALDTKALYDIYEWCLLHLQELEQAHENLA